MAWSGWSQFKGQLTTITKDLLTETTQETADPETELAVTRSRLNNVEVQNTALIAEVEQLTTRAQAAELRALEDADRLKKSEEQVKKLTAKLESVKNNNTSSNPSTLDKESSNFIVSDDEHSMEDDWASQHSSRKTALEQSRAEAEYWRMVAASSSKQQQQPDDLEATRKANAELELQVKEFEKQLNDERVRHELEVVAIRELYERRLIEAQTPEDDSAAATIQVGAKEASCNTDVRVFQDVHQQTEDDDDASFSTSNIPVESDTHRLDTATVTKCDYATLTDKTKLCEIGCNTNENLINFALASKNRTAYVENVHNIISAALEAKDFSTLADCLLSAIERLSNYDDDGIDVEIPLAGTFVLENNGGVLWRVLSTSKTDSSTSTIVVGNEEKFTQTTAPVAKAVSQVVLLNAEVQCEEESTTATELETVEVATEEASCQTDLVVDDESAEEVQKLQAEVESTKAERDHFSSAAHQQHSEAVRLFAESERWRQEADRLRSHLLQMENEYTAAAVASEEREKALRDQLARTSDSGPALDNAVREKNALTDKLTASEAETKRLTKQISALQTALDQLQLNAESQFSIERDRMTKEVAQVKRDLETARLRAAESTKSIDRLRRTNEELTASEQNVTTLKSELERINAERMKATSLASELRATLSDCIERRIVRGLVAACLQAPPGQRQSEAIHLVAKIVGVTEVELKQASTVASSRSSSSPNSLGEMFVKFLETESDAGTRGMRLSLAPVGTPTSGVGSSQQSTPTPSPLSIFGRWPFSAGSQSSQPQQESDTQASRPPPPPYESQTPTTTGTNKPQMQSDSTPKKTEEN